MKSELISGMLAAAVLSGCAATTTPHTDEKFGDAVNRARAQQTINPGASQNTDPVKGVDGQAANSSIDNYHKAYEMPAPAPTGGGLGTVGVMGTTLK